jgi:hypothetical protein
MSSFASATPADDAAIVEHFQGYISKRGHTLVA